jgi:hypothetical protein
MHERTWASSPRAHQGCTPVAQVLGCESTGPPPVPAHLTNATPCLPAHPTKATPRCVDDKSLLIHLDPPCLFRVLTLFRGSTNRSRLLSRDWCALHLDSRSKLFAHERPVPNTSTDESCVICSFRLERRYYHMRVQLVAENRSTTLSAPTYTARNTHTHTTRRGMSPEAPFTANLCTLCLLPG